MPTKEAHIVLKTCQIVRAHRALGVVALADRVIELAAFAELLHDVNRVLILKHLLQPRDVQAAAQLVHHPDLALDVRLVRRELGRVLRDRGRPFGHRLTRVLAAAAVVEHLGDDAVRAAADLALDRVQGPQAARVAVVGVACSAWWGSSSVPVEWFPGSA